jgi:hypothetical protein
MGDQGEGIKGPTRHLEVRRLAVRGGRSDVKIWRCDELRRHGEEGVELDKRGPCASERGEKKCHG